MFGKKECVNCEKKISNKYEFCPHCGSSFSESRKEDFGMLGKDDSEEEFGNEFEQFSKAIFGGIGGRMINKMLGSTMKMLEKEMQREMNKKDHQPRTNFQLFINGKKANLDNFNNLNFPVQKQKINKKIKEIKSVHFSKDKLKKFSKLKKEEPKTNIRRLADKVIYEINIPETSSINDVSIIKLENSIEIKAVAKNKAYFKVIPINFPVTDYDFLKGKLILEMDARR